MAGDDVQQASWERAYALPTGSEAARWLTVRPERTVLGVIHNVTSATRLLDLLRVFEGDRRIQTVFTCPNSSPFERGIAEFVHDNGLAFLPWQQATDTSFDLAITTSRGGDLQLLRAPIIGTPHGMGYNKTLRREPGAGSREPGAGSREPGAGSREPGAYGLSPEWLLHDGQPIPAAIVLSHTEQLDRLVDSCPEAAPLAVVAGDPCIDQLRASLPFRDDYRRSWGLLPGQRLVVLSSTWSGQSQLGQSWDVVTHCLATLPSDEFRVAAIVHPNVWYAHSAWQLRSWLAPLLSAGLLLTRPEGDTWKAALVAADTVVGDYGSTTFYGAALGIPTLLSSRPAAGTVAEDSPIAELLPLLDTVDLNSPLVAHIEHTERVGADPRIAKVTEKATSVPGDSTRILRTLFYARIDLPEPAEPAAVRPVGLPEVPASPHTVPIEPPTMVSAVVETSTAVALRRYPAELATRAQDHLVDAHLVVDEAEPSARLRRLADVVLAHRRNGTPAEECVSAALRMHPGSWLGAAPDGDGACVVGTASGWRGRVTWPTGDPRASTAAAASAVYAALTTGHRTPPPEALYVRLGSVGIPLTVTTLAPRPAGDVPPPPARR